MSLVAFALRVCMVKAFRGATFAGDNVADAPVDPVALAVAASTPSIAVFCDTESMKPDGLRSLTDGDRKLDMVVHIFLPNQVSITVNGQDYKFAGRRAGAALVVDLIYRNMQQILMGGTSVWATLWRSLVTKIDVVDSRAYVLQIKDSGTRLPAREYTFRCDTLFDPHFGEPPKGFWADFLAAMQADADLSPLAALIEGAITGGAALPAWLVEQISMGETPQDANQVGLGPLDGSTTLDEVLFTGATLASGPDPEAPGYVEYEIVSGQPTFGV